MAMNRVRQTAINELQRQLNNANEEFKKQMQYRNSLNYQIEDNQRKMVSYYFLLGDSNNILH